MKNRSMLVMILLVLGAVVWIANGQSAKEISTQTWEYGALKELSTIDVWSWDARPMEPIIEAKSLAELFRKLGGTGQLPDGGRVVFFNLLGSKGWEVVREDDGGADMTFTWFKRSKRSKQ